MATPQNNYRIDNPLEIDFSVRDKILPLERLKARKFVADALYNATDRAGGGCELISFASCLKYSPSYLNAAA